MGSAQKPTDEGKRAGTRSSSARITTPTRKKTAQGQGQDTSVGQEAQQHVSPIELIHARLRRDDIRFTELLEQQGGFPFSDVVRRIYQKGVLLEAATSAPDEEGRYGLYTGARLAELLLPTVDALIAFVMRHGHTPHTIGVLQELLNRGGARLSSVESGASEKTSTITLDKGGLLTEVAPAAIAAISLFTSAPTEDEGESEDYEGSW